jgi:hypothetical protein
MSGDPEKLVDALALRRIRDTYSLDPGYAQKTGGPGGLFPPGPLMLSAGL